MPRTVHFLRPLASRRIAAFWAALTLVELGAHVGSFALVWLAVELIGENAAYLQSLQFATVILGAAFGSYIFDARDPRSVLIGAYAMRAAMTLCPVLAAWLTGSALIGLFAAAIGIALAQAQAEPAVQASMTSIAPAAELRQAVNALIFATLRAARLIGRGAPAALILFIPVIHLMTLSAALVAIAAMLVVALPRAATGETASRAALRGTFAGARHILADRELGTFMVTTAVSFAVWSVVVGLGPALIVHARQATWLGLPPAASYSLLLAAYGFGNLFATGTLARSPSIARVFVGQSLFGGGGVLLGIVGAWSPDAWAIPAMLLAMFVAGLGAGGHDLRLTNIIQGSGPSTVISALARVRMIVGWGSMCAATFAAPPLFNLIDVAASVSLAGTTMVAASLWAWHRLRALDRDR